MAGTRPERRNCGLIGVYHESFATASMSSFWRNQWEQIRGNAKYDILGRLVGVLWTTGMLAGAWASIRWWLSQPVEPQILFIVWIVFSLLLTFMWLARPRLIPLVPCLDGVDQNPNGTGYRRPGQNIAFVAPFKNQSRWWHSALPESRKIIAHIDFFTPGGQHAHSDDADQSFRFEADQIGAKRRRALSV